MSMRPWFAAALLLGSAPMAAAQTDGAQGWISHAEAETQARPIVLHFRRTVDIKARPKSYKVRVTADNRFILFVNGQRVASGPSTGDTAHWREESIDLAPWLKRGRNVIAATVWNGVQPLKLPPDASAQQIAGAQGAALFTGTAPLFQQSIATGFRLTGEGDAAEIATGKRGWRVKRDAGHGFANGWRQEKYWYYVAGNPETIDAAKADFDAAEPRETGDGWQDAVPAPDAAARTLVIDRLPQQSYAPASVGKVVRTDLPAGAIFPARPVTIPANSKVTLLLQRDAMLSAYPELDVSGGQGATIRLTWAEALYDAKNRKGDRDLIEDRRPIGIWDTFVADGKARRFATLWWRTWRYAEIAVETKDQPLTLQGFRAFETGYPFEQVGRFASDDPQLQRIFDVGWRTARIDAHETYMDTAYWEQLQYAGDTRLQMLISYAVSGDPRLAEQAIDAYAASNVDGGLIESAWPTRGNNVIAPFALLWVGMLDDWRMRQRDPAPIIRNIGRMREILDWFEAYRGKRGLLTKNPQWNFVDWVGQSATDRTQFPSYGKAAQESCLMSVHWLGALQQGAAIEAAFGDNATGERYAARAATVKAAIRERCWVPTRGLFADNPDGDRFSQHMNALAVLNDVVPQDEARAILGRVMAPGKGIDAPEGVTQVSYYFAWYLAQALVHAKMGDRYVGLLDTWRDLLKMNYTAWPEERDGAGQAGKNASTRSDSHAWSAHPTADLLGIVAGIGPDAPGYARLKVEPALGPLRNVSATAATPYGPVSVRYRIAGDRLTAIITRPKNLPGDFVWNGKRYPLAKMTTTWTVPRR
ncbi:alpha-L-rhamnosidase C-terminal domain-containing protein [Sphingobium sp.]|uniref:alpha-L-rhamnosidase-related protein n=1 Tax=Sphingobium sp. TaxID=1912891 RepID=UPI002C13F665|nr:alpha-L-rhamnosidase C-terminal domain-containing protein [Sphingobium sp.]HUD90896.1 alpha-L-rhamnosidase C-terminal domain-containing protein [Sphingobium sp.]